jgi:hypothetical protein
VQVGAADAAPIDLDLALRDLGLDDVVEADVAGAVEHGGLHLASCGDETAS